MEIFSTTAGISDHIKKLKDAGKTIGFIPTMGALHKGHISLINLAKSKTDVVVCSIFVNPTQFNDPEDLKKYPRPVESDTQKLEESECDVLFIPTVSEMYPENESWHIDLGELEHILEGKFRPGHYQGVTQIVKKLFDIVKPDVAFFGQKDFQQVCVITRMVDQLSMPVKIEMCPIIRDDDGLAMSSRNTYLSPDERRQALALSASLKQAAAHFDALTLEELKNEASGFLDAQDGVQLEYFEIYNTETLKSAQSKQENHLIALVAARVGRTRLIDNVMLK